MSIAVLHLHLHLHLCLHCFAPLLQRTAASSLKAALFIPGLHAISLTINFVGQPCESGLQVLVPRSTQDVMQFHRAVSQRYHWCCGPPAIASGMLHLSIRLFEVGQPLDGTSVGRACLVIGTLEMKLRSRLLINNDTLEPRAK